MEEMGNLSRRKDRRRRRRKKLDERPLSHQF